MPTKVQDNTNICNSVKPAKASKIGLSIVSHLSAAITIKKRQNGECQVFTQDLGSKKSAKKCTNNGRPKGQIIQQGLTKRGRKTIRVVSDCYNLMVTDKYFRENVEKDLLGEYDGSSCRFITLTFRNIIPSDVEAKSLLHNFFRRFSRLFGRTVHYIWVAERQKRGAIHFHILTPENIGRELGGSDSKECRKLENMWVNEAWNEVVCNWAKKEGKVTEKEAVKWMNEYHVSEKYYEKLMRYQLGLRITKPRKPAMSEFLLLPNCIHVLRVGNYMAKYMSKGQNIVGGMYGCSQRSRKFMEEEVRYVRELGTVFECNNVVRYMERRAKEDGTFVGVYELEHNESKILWCRDFYSVLGWMYEYEDLVKTERVDRVRGLNRLGNKLEVEKI